MKPVVPHLTRSQQKRGKGKSARSGLAGNEGSFPGACRPPPRRGARKSNRQQTVALQPRTRARWHGCETAVPPAGCGGRRDQAERMVRGASGQPLRSGSRSNAIRYAHTTHWTLETRTQPTNAMQRTDRSVPKLPLMSGRLQSRAQRRFPWPGVGGRGRLGPPCARETLFENSSREAVFRPRHVLFLF